MKNETKINLIEDGINKGISSLCTVLRNQKALQGKSIGSVNFMGTVNLSDHPAAAFCYYLFHLYALSQFAKQEQQDNATLDLLEAYLSSQELQQALLRAIALHASDDAGSFWKIFGIGQWRSLFQRILAKVPEATKLQFLKAVYFTLIVLANKPLLLQFMSVLAQADPTLFNAIIASKIDPDNYYALRCLFDPAEADFLQKIVAGKLRSEALDFSVGETASHLLIKKTELDSQLLLLLLALIGKDQADANGYFAYDLCENATLRRMLSNSAQESYLPLELQKEWWQNYLGQVGNGEQNLSDRGMGPNKLTHSPS